MSKATELYGITSLSQLKHFALNCGVKLELIERFGKTGEDIPPKLRGIRSIYAVHTKSFDLLSEDGSTSSLEIERAALVSFDGPMMTVHKAGIRPMNDEEKAKMAAWQEIENTPEFQERSRVDLLTDGSRTYWQKKAFFEGEFSYLFNGEKAGKSMVYRKDDVPMILDKSIAGEPILVYKMYRADIA